MKYLRQLLLTFLIGLQVWQPAMAAGFLDNITDALKTKALQTVSETLADGVGVAKNDPKGERAMSPARQQEAAQARQLFAALRQQPEQGAQTQTYDPSNPRLAKLQLKRWKDFVARTKGKKTLSPQEMSWAVSALRPFMNYYVQGNGKRPLFQGNQVSIPPSQTVRLEMQGYCMDHTTAGPASGEKLQLVPIEQLIDPSVVDLYQAMMQYSALHPEDRGEMQNLVWGLRHAADASPPIRQLNARQRALLDAAAKDGASRYQTYLDQKVITGKIQEIRKQLFRQALGKIQQQTHIALPDPSAAGYTPSDARTVVAALSRMPVEGDAQANSDYTMLAPGVAAHAVANNVNDVFVEVRNTSGQPYVFDAGQYAGQSTRVTQRVAFGGLKHQGPDDSKGMLERLQRILELLEIPALKHLQSQIQQSIDTLAAQPGTSELAQAGLLLATGLNQFLLPTSLLDVIPVGKGARLLEKIGMKEVSALEKAADKYRRASGALDQAVIDRISSIPKGTRPDPSTYLSPEYIANHLGKFDDGASRFMTKTNLEKYGIGQRDGTSFVMPNQEADQLLAAAKGDKCAMEQALGLPENFLQSNELVRVDIPKPADANLRIPSGNEAGANDLWIPGGVLPDGNTEAVIDALKLDPGKFTVKPLQF